MKKLENMLASNMRRFKTKNLFENIKSDPNFIEDENKQAEMAIENCDENNDMAMERCVDNLFADMTEKEAENYIKELSMQKPPWLIKLIRWFRREGKKIRRQVKKTKPPERALAVGAALTFATLTALIMTHTREIVDRMGNNQ